MSSRWIRTLALLSAGLLSTTLAACSGGSGSQTPSDPNAPLEVWTRSAPDSAKTYENVFAAFTKKTGIAVKYQAVLEFDTQLQSRASAKDLPDVLINDAGLMGTYQSQGIITPIDRAAIVGQDQISDQTWDQNKGRDGQYYGVPYSRQAFITLVRKDWREKVGAKVPKTWEELSQLADDFAKKDPDGNGKADTYGMVIPGTSKQGYIGWWASSYIWQGGGDLVADKGGGKYAAAFSSPGTKQALVWIQQQFCTPGHVVPGAINLTTTDSPFFGEGSAGIYHTGPYNLSRYDEQVGKDKFEVIAAPAGPAGTTTLAEGENIYFGAASDKADKQKALAEFLVTPEAQEIAMTSTKFPVVRLPVNTTLDAEKTYADPRWGVVQKAYESDAKTFVWSINFQPIRQALGEGINAMMADCSSNLDAGMAKVDEAINAELSQQGLS